MEFQQQNNQNQQQQQNEDDGSGSSKSTSFLCRQSSTRWTPTTDQIRILKDLYYNNGVRSPSAEQIQRISSRLRQYGKIEGKNVFYWFQNHKARERQKKRFTTEISMQRNGNSTWRSSHEDPTYNKYSIISPGVPSPTSSSTTSSTSPAVVAVGQMGSYGYGSVPMEKSFRDCSISAGCSGGGRSIAHNFWVGSDLYNYSPNYPFFDKRKSIGENPTEDEEQEQEQAPEIETLPLFPMYSDNISSSFCSLKPQSNGYYTTPTGWYPPDDGHGGSRTCLELSINSYTGMSSAD